MSVRRPAPVAFALLATLALFAVLPAGAQDIGLQLEEIRTLVREKRYPLALESLRLVARQIQDLRLEAIAPAFPEPPPGWSATPPLSLNDEGDIWSGRLVAQRSYDPAAGTTRLDLVIDLNSPHAPAAALALSPLVLAADPTIRARDIGGQQARVRFVPDTGEGEVRILLGRDTRVTARGRGIASAEPLVRLTERVDFTFLGRGAGIRSQRRGGLSPHAGHMRILAIPGGDRLEGYCDHALSGQDFEVVFSRAG